jgi:hypothetical protein
LIKEDFAGVQRRDKAFFFAFFQQTRVKMFYGDGGKSCFRYYVLSLAKNINVPLWKRFIIIYVIHSFEIKKTHNVYTKT